MLRFNARTITIPLFQVGVGSFDLADAIAAARAALAPMS